MRHLIYGAGWMPFVLIYGPRNFDHNYMVFSLCVLVQIVCETWSQILKDRDARE